MSFWINKQLIIIAFLGIMLSQTGVNASFFFDDENSSQAKPTAQKAKANKTRKTKRDSTLESSQQSLDQFFSPSKKAKLAENDSPNTSVISNTNVSVDLTLNDVDKENDPSPMQEQTSSSKATDEELAVFRGYFSPYKKQIDKAKPLAQIQPKTPTSSPEEIAKFNKRFSQPAEVDYEAIKARKLAEKFQISKKGHLYLRFSPLESVDKRKHLLVVFENELLIALNKKIKIFKGSLDTKYLINETSLSQEFSDLDSVKRAAINIIYNNK